VTSARTLLLATLLVFTAAMFQGDVRAGDDSPPNDRQVKAAFIVRVLSFVEWPPSTLGAPADPLVVAVIGDEAFAALLGDAAAGHDVRGRTITVRAVTGPEDARSAHLVFIAGSQARHLPNVLRELSTTSALTVGDSAGFARQGVALNFYTFGKRVRLEINSAAAARAGLRLNANLMRVARIVE
jgi:hypothetical protein